VGHLHKHSSFDRDDLRIEDKRFRGEQFRMNIETVNRLRAYADQEKLSLVQLALGWIRQNPMIASVVVGAKSRLQIRQSILASDIELTPEQVIAVDQIVGSNIPQRVE
jgi:aryl-alcohol dehydrogenase-like predicted oxidoreductase